jgi:ubiquinone/menaquinone biosynthesis C-methylase UbiE
MTNPFVDADFNSSIPELYQACMVPMLFETYADDLTVRAVALLAHGISAPDAGEQRVLEVAAGTGVVTRALAQSLPQSVGIVASDLNQSMLEQAKLIPLARSVEWRQADAGALPFADHTFDLVVCQFGVMFFPDKVRAFAEVRRVLKPGGTFLFNSWDCIEQNAFAHTVSTALVSLFAESSPHFMARTPHGYYERNAIERDIKAGGFTAPIQFETLAKRSRATSPRAAAVAFCQGTPMRNEVLQRDPTLLGEATEIAARALAEKFGTDAIDGAMQAHVVTAVN